MKKIRIIFSKYKNIFIGQISNLTSFAISTSLLFINLFFLSVEDRGIYGLIYTLPSILIILTDFGITPILIRYISRGLNTSKILSTLLFLHLLRISFTLIIGVIIIKLAGYYFYNVQNKYLFLALPIILSLSANSYLTPYFYGINKISRYYLLITLPNLLILCFSIFLILTQKFILINIIYSSIYIYIFHSIIVVIMFIHQSRTFNLNYYKEFHSIIKESKFLYISNTLTFGYIYIFPIIINIKFGLTNLSYVLFCIAICDKLFLIGDSVGYEIIRKINLDLSENVILKFKYLNKVLFFMLPIIIFSTLMILLITKYVLLEHFFIKYKPVLAFFIFVLFQYFCQSFQRIYLQFYNGLGKSNFSFFITSISVSIKLVILLICNYDITTTLLFLSISDLFILFTLIYINSFNIKSFKVCF
jgi:O-antigen/teichoic acid export membrane protein